MVLYIPIKRQLYHRDLGSYTTYGIAAWVLPACPKTARVIVPDVSPDWRFTAALALHCTAARLDPAHLQDVVEDSL